MKYKAGKSFLGLPPFGGMLDPHRMHVVEIIDEGRKVIDEPDHIRRMIVYRIFGKHKQWWHYFICTESEFDDYVKRHAKRKIANDKVAKKPTS